MSGSSYILKDDDEKLGQDWKALTHLLGFVRPYWGKLVASLLMIISSAMMSIFSARSMGLLVEKGLMKKDWSKAWMIAVIILFLELLSILLSWRGRKSLSHASSHGLLLIRQTLFQHIHALPLSYYDRQPEGRTVTRMTHDVEGIEEFFTSGLGRLFTSFMTFIIALVGMLITDFALGLKILISLIPAIGILYMTRHKIRLVNRIMSRCNSACNARLSEYLKGISVIRIFGLESWSKKNYDQVVDRHLLSQLEANTFYGWSRPLISLLCSFPLLGLILFGGKAVFEGTLSLGIFVTFIRYCERISNPLAILTREIHIIQQALTSMERVSAFLNAQREEDVLGKDGHYNQIPLQGHLVFDKVTMGYDPETIVLREIDLEIAPGEKVGIVGTTGSGKTTAVSLLARLYDFQLGEILVDGRPIRHYQRSFLRECIGLVSQDVVIFRGSLRDNLTCEANIPDEDIEEAIKQTGLKQVMGSNNWNLDMEILEGGANLSTGEKQLISLTRVLLKDPKILILDEATGNIDPYYEEIIHKAVGKVMNGRTCLLIAHRLDTLKNCHRILVFRDGRLVEEGSHGDLLSQKGYFYELQKQSEKQSDWSLHPI